MNKVDEYGGFEVNGKAEMCLNYCPKYPIKRQKRRDWNVFEIGGSWCSTGAHKNRQTWQIRKSGSNEIKKGMFWNQRRIKRVEHENQVLRAAKTSHSHTSAPPSGSPFSCFCCPTVIVWTSDCLSWTPCLVLHWQKLVPNCSGRSKVVGLWSRMLCLVLENFVFAQVALGLGATQKMLSQENLENTKLCSHKLRLVLVGPRGQL